MSSNYCKTLAIEAGMKVVCWNLENIGTGKLAAALPQLNQWGLGADVLDFVTKVVAADPAWQHITGNNTADIFVIVELVTGGQSKGSDSTGSSLTSMTHIANSLNAATGAGHNYVAVTPALVTGYHECVGVIYNSNTVTFTNKGVLRKSNNNRYLLPRSPYWVRFTDVGNNNPLNLIAVHAPTTGADPNRYRDPIAWSNSLGNVNEITQVAEPSLLMGDFNCGPVVFYTSRKRDSTGAFVVHQEQAFTSLPMYGSRIPNLPPTPAPAANAPVATLSSLRNAIVAANAPPLDYLNEAYDNILFQGIAPHASSVWDLIGGARDANNGNVALYPAQRANLLQDYRVVSDHMPVAIEF